MNPPNPIKPKNTKSTKNMDNPNDAIDYTDTPLRSITLAGGCFWGAQAYLRRLPGVAETVCGYANGSHIETNYQEVCGGETGHVEAVRVAYDAARLPLARLLALFFRIIDPTLRNRQGNDVGRQYRTGVYYSDTADLPVIEAALARLQTRYAEPIVTEVLPLAGFYPAEEYHQAYLEKNPGGYCHVNLALLYEPLPESD